MRPRNFASVVCALVGLLASAPARADRAPLPDAETGPAPKIVLITMGKGDVVWQKFGHGAICVEYPQQTRKRSLCYNYGTTDFTRPVSVGWGFLRGEGKFWVSVTTPERMIRRYREEFDRTLWGQTIPLSDEKARALATRLQINALPENRNYIYHHFYDNCTTRIRDLLDEATDGKLRAGSEGKPGPTFREYARQGFSQDEWLLVATDFFLGHGADIQPDLWQAMFLPEYLMQVVEDQLGAKPEVIYQRRGPPLTDGDSSGRFWVVLVAFLMALPLLFARWRGRFEKPALYFAGIVLFLAGFAVWFLAIVTAVNEFRYNENLLILLPTDLALLFLGPARRMAYARIRIAMVALASLLLVVGVFTQPLWAQWTLVLLPMVVIAVPSFGASDPRVGSTGESDDSSADGQKSGSKPSGKSRSGPSKKKKKQRK